MIPLFKLSPPETLINFFEILKTIAAFDVIPDEWLFYLYSVILDLGEDEVPEALNPKFEELGFLTIWSVHNLGSLAIFLACFPILALLDLLLRPFKEVEQLKKLQIKINESIYWNSTIRIIIESYTILLVVSLVNTTDMTYDKFGTQFISSSTIFFLIICITFPFASSLFILKNFSKLNDPEFEEQYGALYEGIRINSRYENFEKKDCEPDNKSAIWYQFWFLFRRLILGVLVVYSRDTLYW